MKTFSSEVQRTRFYAVIILAAIFAFALFHGIYASRPAPEPEADRAANPPISAPLPTVSVPTGATEGAGLVPLPPILTELYIDNEGWLWTRKSRGWVRLPFLVEIPGQDEGVEP